ncbi:MNIO family bufferin maturase [Paludibacterium paludis]|uniref:Uncharacterized protein n=1 Tax=Paludibacterium paludis TaxID=1225769 RepID=A0A918P129_9NEIS|nr:DUF692 domain-containing protein [Paludibacterium paludis]GGY11234.1 hypothetical protein GCM10011289_12680 [Paludibacterium paludis]
MTALPIDAGIGLRAPHYREVLDTLPPLGWVEVHSENFIEGGMPLDMLGRVREHWPVSLHGVGLGLASPARPDRGLLAALRRLIDRIEPAAVSEHLAFNHDGAHRYVNDLLPVPRTKESLAMVASHVREAQDALGRPLLLENLSSYADYPGNTLNEGEFLAELSRLTGCGVLLDLNNLFVNRANLGTDIDAVLKALPADIIGEIHLAGHSTREGMLIDTHDHPIDEAVWTLFESVVATLGPKPTLIEWDQSIPPLHRLRAEAGRARAILEKRHGH